MKNLMISLIVVLTTIFVGCGEKNIKCHCGCSDCTGLICENNSCIPCSCNCKECVCPGGKSYKK